MSSGRADAEVANDPHGIADSDHVNAGDGIECQADAQASPPHMGGGSDL